MKIGDIEARPGEKAFGYLESSRTATEIPIHIPVNIVRGAEDGPTLLVSGAVHGQEISGTLALGKILRELDPQALRGTLIAVPVTNTSAFEFHDRVTKWDGQNLNRGAANHSMEGSPTEQIAHLYLTELVPHADAIIDIHSGRPTSYVWYTIYPGDHETPENKEIIEKSKQMAIAYGLRQIFRTRPKSWGGGLKDAALDMGKPVITPEVGGGADFYRNGDQQIEACERGILNVMKLMGMLDGEIVTESPQIEICDGHIEIYSGTHAGIMRMACERGDYLEKGDVFVNVYNPFTGELKGQVLAPEAGKVLNTAVVWPVVGQNSFLGVLGDVVEVVDVDF